MNHGLNGAFLVLPGSKIIFAILIWAPECLSGSWFTVSERPPHTPDNCFLREGPGNGAEGLTRRIVSHVQAQMCVAPGVTFLTICYCYLI